MEVVGGISNFESLAEQWSDVEADIVLVEASSGQFKQVIDSLAGSQLGSEAAIVVLSEHSEPGWFAEALRAGVRAVLPSNISPDELVAGLEAAAAGLIVLHPAEVDAMFPAAELTSSPLAELVEPLTPRENEVLQMLASGLANKEIAARLRYLRAYREISRGFDSRQAGRREPHRSCHYRHSSRPRSSVT